MNCPRCQSPLEDPSAKFCPLCGASVVPPPPAHTPAAAPEPPAAGGLGGPTWQPTPAAAEPPPASSAGPAAPQSSTAHCAVHADRAAVDICSRCGAFACRECLVIGADGQGVCSACLARQGGETGPLPWERRSELGFFKGYWETTKNIMFNPNTAFDRVQSETGQWWDPLLYAIVSYVIGYFWIAVFYGISMGAGIATGMSRGGSMNAGATIGAGLGLTIGILIFLPVGALMTAFIGAGIEHVALMVVGVPVRPFEATLRGYCYGQAPFFWGVVPFCGMYAFPVWHIVCRIFGYKSLHRTTGGKAAAGVLVPMALCCGVVAIFYGAIFAAAIAGKH